MKYSKENVVIGTLCVVVFMLGVMLIRQRSTQTPSVLGLSFNSTKADVHAVVDGIQNIVNVSNKIGCGYLQQQKEMVVTMIDTIPAGTPCSVIMNEIEKQLKSAPVDGVSPGDSQQIMHEFSALVKKLGAIFCINGTVDKDKVKAFYVDIIDAFCK